MQNFHLDKKYSPNQTKPNQTELTIFFIFVFHHLEKKIVHKIVKQILKNVTFWRNGTAPEKKLIFILGWELCYAEWVWTEFDYGYGRTGQEI